MDGSKCEVPRSSETKTLGESEHVYSLGQRIKVLVVDDSALMRSAVKRILESSSYNIEVDVAADGQEGLKMVKAAQYELVFSDIEMPVMDGIEFIKRCKINSDATIIVLSSVEKLDDEQMEKIRHFGADGVVAKPRGALSGKEKEILEALKQVASRLR